MCSISYFVIKRESANHSWRPSSKAARIFKEYWCYLRSRKTARRSPFHLRKKQCHATSLGMDNRQPPWPLTHNLHRQSVANQGNWASFSSDPPHKIPPKRSTGPDNSPVGTRAQKNPWQRARRHRSQSTRYNHQRPCQAHPRDPSSIEHSQIHHQQIRGLRRYTAGSPGLKVERPLVTVRVRSSLRAFERFMVWNGQNCERLHWFFSHWRRQHALAVEFVE